MADAATDEDVQRKVIFLAADETLKHQLKDPRGVSLEDMITRGEALIEASARGYRAELETVIAAMREVGTPLIRDCDDAQAARKLFRLAHDLRGQAATLGWPIMTEIGTSLCRLLIESEDQRGACRHFDEAIKVHLDAFALALAQDMEGAIGPDQRVLLNGLTRSVDAAIAPLSRSDQAL